MNFDFSESMAASSDADIIRILTSERNNYQELAIKAAERELQKRNLSVEQIEEIKKANASLQTVQEKKSTILLNFIGKCWPLFFPIFSFLFFQDFLKVKGTIKRRMTLRNGQSMDGSFISACLFTGRYFSRILLSIL